MKLLETLSIATVRASKRLEIYHGDLTDLRSSVDLLIISAGPEDYIPTPGSLMGALHRRGIVVAQLAMSKQLDLTGTFSCWMSGDISTWNVGFRRILCFEPRQYRGIPELVRRFFQAVIAVLAEGTEFKTAAMPVVFSGGAGLPMPAVLEALIDGAVHWMALGLPLECLKIVIYNEKRAADAAKILSARKDRYKTSPFRPRAESTHDLFISYARENWNAVHAFVEDLKREDGNIRVYIDNDDLNIGGIWQHELFMALDSCRKMVAFLSPQYLASPFCIEEFNIALLRGRSEDEGIVYPIYLHSAALPYYFLARQLNDCREGDAVKLKDACRRILSTLARRTS